MVIYEVKPIIHNAVMDIYETRRLNLIALIGNVSVHGTVANFARQHNEDPAWLRQLIKKNRRMGEKAARRLEASLKIAPLSLDRPIKQEVNESRASYGSTPLSQEALELARLYDSIPEHLRPAALKWLQSLQEIE